MANLLNHHHHPHHGHHLYHRHSRGCFLSMQSIKRYSIYRQTRNYNIVTFKNHVYGQAPLSEWCLSVKLNKEFLQLVVSNLSWVSLLHMRDSYTVVEYHPLRAKRKKANANLIYVSKENIYKIFWGTLYVEMFLINNNNFRSHIISLLKKVLISQMHCSASVPSHRYCINVL